MESLNQTFESHAMRVIPSDLNEWSRVMMERAVHGPNGRWLARVIRTLAQEARISISTDANPDLLTTSRDEASLADAEPGISFEHALLRNAFLYPKQNHHGMVLVSAVPSNTSPERPAYAASILHASTGRSEQQLFQEAYAPLARFGSECVSMKIHPYPQEPDRLIIVAIIEHPEVSLRSNDAVLVHL